MGLDIYGEKTGGHWSGSYSTLHHTVRWLALKYSGLPDSVGTEEDGKPINAFAFFMYPWPGHGSYTKKFDVEQLQRMLFSLEVAGHLFPNIMLHSDCDGQYTLRGKVLQSPGLLYGNSKQLLKELDMLCAENDFIQAEDERTKQALQWTVELRDIVRNEIENGSGRILFR